jgi:hypothetical protein
MTAYDLEMPKNCLGESDEKTSFFSATTGLRSPVAFRLS